MMSILAECFNVVKWVTIVICFVVTLTVIEQYNRKRLNDRRYREGYSEERYYYQPLRAKAVSENITEKLLIHFREWGLFAKPFAVRADDKLVGLYWSSDPLDIEDALKEVVALCDLKLDVKHTDFSHVNTIEDLAVFLSCFPPKSKLQSE